MNIGMAQIDTHVGNIEKNKEKILSSINKLKENSDVIVFPEMTTTGYPPQDLLNNKEFVKKQKEIIYKVRDVVSQTQDDLTVILGFVDYETAPSMPNDNMIKYNAAAVINDDIKIYHKQLLPSYDVFYDKRYFQSGDKPLFFKLPNDKIGTVTICEDIWDQGYEKSPIEDIADQNIDVDYVFNISSSPYHNGKPRERLDILENHHKTMEANYVYLNQVGAQDELVFDGQSMILNKQGLVKHLSPNHKEKLSTIDMTNKYEDQTLDILNQNEYKNILESLKLGVKDYLEKNGLNKVVIGLSGGVDSSLSLYILSQILDPEDITVVTLPTKHTSKDSFDDIQALTDNLGLDYITMDISDEFELEKKKYQNTFGKKLSGTAYENTQARIRMGKLLQVSNSIPGSLVANNSNKTEIALGYGTYGGDLLGQLGILGDLNKKQVYELCEYINSIEDTPDIPENIIQKPASAELNDDQTDPFDYDLISEPVDRLLANDSIQEILQDYDISEDRLKKLKKRVERSEFKRKQSPKPIIKVNPKSIGQGRKVPMTTG